MNDKKPDILLLIISAIGFSATFMPWLYLPRMEQVVYGYNGDGILTGISFALLLLLGVGSIFSKKDLLYFRIILLSIFGFFAYRSISSYQTLMKAEDVIINDNELLTAGLAGNYPGYGIVVYGIASVMAVLVLGYQIFELLSNESDTKSSNSKFMYVASTVLLVLGAAYLLMTSSKPSAKELDIVITENYNKMTEAFESNQYAKFVTYYHPSFIQANGGKEFVTDLVKNTSESLSKSGYILKDITLDKIESKVVDSKNIQAVLVQNITMESNAIAHSEKQKLLAISEDNGNVWHFINIDKKSMTEIKKIYPLLNPNINF